MQKPPFLRWQGMLVCSTVIPMLLLITACSSLGNTGSGQPTTTTGTTPTPTSVAQASPTSPQPTGSTPTATPVAFKPGGISFIGPVTSRSSSGLVMSGPDGQSYTLLLNAQTALSSYNGTPPAVGTSVNMDAAANPDGSFTATILKPGDPNDPDLHVIKYTGITTSTVGADRVIHFTVGSKAYVFPISRTAVLTDFGGNAQAIGINASVAVKVLFPAKTVVSVGNGP